MEFWTSCKSCPKHFRAALQRYFPGVAICLIIAAAAQFLAEHYGAPQMLFALLLGMTLHFLMDDARSFAGIEYSAKGILRLGVALLGFRITLDQIVGLGLGTILWVSAGVIVTIIFGIFMARLNGQGTQFGVLSGGAVAICGASAAMAISAVLPHTKNHERDTIFTVLTVTAMSTIAMVLYPIIAEALNLNHTEAGIFLGGTIHDVAQVVGAGYGISESTGDTSTIIKLFRVALLMPVVLCIGVAFTYFVKSRSDDGQRGTPPFPWFLVVFCIFVGLNSYDMVPVMVKDPLIELSKWCLVTAIAALGIKTSIKSLLDVGTQPLIMIISETVFIMLWVLAGLFFILG